VTPPQILPRSPMTSSDDLEALAAYAQTRMNLARAQAGQPLCTLEDLPRHEQDGALLRAKVAVQIAVGKGPGEPVTIDDIYDAFRRIEVR